MRITALLPSVGLWILAALTAGCDTDRSGQLQAAGTEAAESKPPVHVDSILPIDEEIRRFKARVGRTAERLDGGVDSRDALVATFVDGVESADTAVLARLVIDAAEFIDLYYPHTMYTREPYELSPDIVWMLTTQNSDKGLVRIVRRIAGQPFGFDGYACDAEPKVEGPNRLWEGCELYRTLNGSREAQRLFGSIIERDGVFKLVSYSNDL